VTPRRLRRPPARATGDNSRRHDPAELVATLYRALPAGSYVFIHHMLDSEDPASATLQAAMQSGRNPVALDHAAGFGATAVAPERRVMVLPG
jgi:hypothetical protein